MTRLTRGQLEARKKRRERNKPIRHYWKLWCQQYRRKYNAQRA